MSNVEYRCPVCSRRLFAPPGGTKLKCPQHPEELYRQVESYDGPDFLYVDEGGQTKSADLVLKGNERRTKGEIELDQVAPDAELAAFRSTYLSLTNEEPDKRWGVARIKEELLEWKSTGPVVADDPNEDTTGGGNREGEHEDTTQPNTESVGT